MPGEIVKTISLALTGFMAAILLFGFLLGLMRGLKKSTLRLCIFVGVSVVVLLFMPLILKVTTSDIVIGGKTLKDYIASLISSGMPETAGALEGPVTMAAALAVAACGSIVFLVLFIGIQIITWIIFGIVKLFLRGWTKKGKKNRLLGGLIGIVQAVFVCFIFMIPVAGFSNVAYKIADAAEVVLNEMKQVEEGSEEGETPASVIYDKNGKQIKLVENGVISGGENESGDVTTPGGDDLTNPDNGVNIEESLKTVAEVKKVAGAYRKSMPGAIFGIGKLDIATFNYLSQATVDGQKIKFSDEVDAVAGSIRIIAEEFDLPTLLNFKNIEELKTYLNKVEKDNKTNGERLFELLADKLFSSDLVKGLMVDGINALSENTQTRLNNLPEAERVELGYQKDEIISIPKINSSNINWKEEKQTFARIFNKAIVCFLEVYPSLNNGGEGETTDTFADLPFEQLGEVIDSFKELKLLENIFDPGLKRLLSVEKFIDGEEIDPETNQKVKITISEKILNETKKIGGEGINLTKIENYKEVSFTSLFKSVGKTMALVSKMQGESFDLGVGDVSDILTSLNELPEELKTQLNDTLKGAINDKPLFGDKTLEEICGTENWNNLNIIECAPVVAPLIDVATVLTTDNTTSGKLDAEQITTVVDSIKNVSTNYEALSEENKTAINNMVTNTINEIVGEGTVTTENAIENLAQESAIIENVLNAKFSEKPVVLNTQQVVDSIESSTIVADLLITNNVTDIFETEATKEEVKTMFADKFPEADDATLDKYANLFKYKAPATNN